MTDLRQTVARIMRAKVRFIRRADNSIILVSQSLNEAIDTIIPLIEAAVVERLMSPEAIEAGARALFVLDERNGGNMQIGVNDDCVNYWFRQGQDATGEDAECYRLCQSLREQAAVVAAAIRASNGDKR